MDMTYDLEEWAAATTSGRGVFNYNYRMTGDELRGWELVNVVAMGNEPGVSDFAYIWQRKGGDAQELLRIHVVERHHWRSAHVQLQEQLRHSMRPDIPRGTGKLKGIGDVNFVGQDQESDLVTMLTFTRGNMFVSIASVGEKPVDVSKAAKALDRSLGEPPTEATIQRGRASDMSPKPVSVKKNQKRTLVKALPEPVSRSGWLKIIAPDGELSRDGDEVVYVPSRGGKKEIKHYLVVE